MIATHVLHQLLIRGETRIALIAGVDHALERPVVPYDVLIPILAVLEATMEVWASQSVAFEVIPTVERLVLR